VCCRYWADESPEIREIVEEMNKSPLVEKWHHTTGITTYGEVRPTNVVPVIASNRSGQRAVFPMKWGFSGRTLLMNARVETVASRPTFRDAWTSHRCIVPASWYFEWEHLVGNDGKKRTGDKYLIQPKDSTMTWLCGLYRIEDGLPVFVVLTREPGEEIRFIHDRMPLIMPGDYVSEWIKPGVKPDDLVDEALTEMVYEKVEKDTGPTDQQMSML
jgi:putative SOS response-associated peptidase YedK